MDRRSLAALAGVLTLKEEERARQRINDQTIKVILSREEGVSLQ